MVPFLILLLQLIFPVVWVDEGADIDEENLDKLKSMLVWVHTCHM